MWGKDPQVDGNGGNALIRPGDAVRLGLNLLTDLIEISELLPFAVQELRPLCRVTHRFSHTCMLNTSNLSNSRSGGVTCVGSDELQNQRPASDDPRSTRKKIPGKHTEPNYCCPSHWLTIIMKD